MDTMERTTGLALGEAMAFKTAHCISGCRSSRGAAALTMWGQAMLTLLLLCHMTLRIPISFFFFSLFLDVSVSHFNHRLFGTEPASHAPCFALEQPCSQ